jgi:beta-xylosidase
MKGIICAFFFMAGAFGANFNQPVLWEDLADLDIFRVNDTFYYSASTMHYSPGAPILQSYDLVNWEFVGHSVPTLDWGSIYNLDGGQAYVKGIWASTLRYRKSNGLWYWIGCVQFSTTYIYTAPSVTGPWTKSGVINTCYYDCSLLIDDNDTMYVAYGGTTISVAQLSANGLSQVKTQQVFSSTIGAIEGSRFYKINGEYYIFNTLPANAEYVLKASSPWGPYTQKLLLKNIATPISGGGVPHQVYSPDIIKETIELTEYRAALSTLHQGTGITWPLSTATPEAESQFSLRSPGALTGSRQ